LFGGSVAYEERIAAPDQKHGTLPGGFRFSSRLVNPFAHFSLSDRTEPTGGVFVMLSATIILRFGQPFPRVGYQGAPAGSQEMQPASYPADATREDQACGEGRPAGFGQVTAHCPG